MYCIFNKSEPLEAPKTPNNSKNNSTQADRIKYTSQGEDGGLDQEYDPLTTIIVDTEEQDSDTSPLPIPRTRGRPKGSKNKPRASEPPTIQLHSEIPSQTGLPDQIDQEEPSQGSIEAP